jgi:hypothetical protein
MTRALTSITANPLNKPTTIQNKEIRLDGSILFSRDEVATRNLADSLKNEHEERQNELTGVSGVFADLLGAALSEVNWYEIAEHYISDVEKSEVQS